MIVGVIFYTVPVLGADMPLIVVWLVVAAAIFTVYFGFINFRGFGHALDLIRGDYSNPDDAGEVTPLPGAGDGALGHGRASATSPASRSRSPSAAPAPPSG